MEPFDLILLAFVQAVRDRYATNEIRIVVSNEGLKENLNAVERDQPLYATEYQPIFTVQTDMELTTLLHTEHAGLNETKNRVLDRFYRELPDYEGVQIQFSERSEADEG